jgi:hypothetical protein
VSSANATPRRIRVAGDQLPPLPDFDALRHTAAMDCEDAEEARDLLRHKNSNVTRIVTRAHFGDRRRELLRARMEARHGSTVADHPRADRGRRGRAARPGQLSAIYGSAMEATDRSRPQQRAPRPSPDLALGAGWRPAAATGRQLIIVRSVVRIHPELSRFLSGLRFLAVPPEMLSCNPLCRAVIETLLSQAQSGADPTPCALATPSRVHHGSTREATRGKARSK